MWSILKLSVYQYFVLIIYLNLIIVCATNAHRKVEKILLGFNIIVVTIVVTVLIGLRPENAGNDTANYIKAYKNLYSFLEAAKVGTETFGSKEPLFWYLVYIIKVFCTHICGYEKCFILTTTILSFLLSIIGVILILKSSNLLNFRNFALILSVLYTSYYLVYSGNAIRQLIVTPLVVVTIYLVVEGRLLLAFLISLLSSFIHFSAGISFLFISIWGIFNRFIPSIKKIEYSCKRKQCYLFLFVTFLLISFSIGLLLKPKYLECMLKSIPLNFLPVISDKFQLYLHTKFACDTKDTVLEIRNFLFLLVIISIQLSKQSFLEANKFIKFLYFSSAFLLSICFIFYYYPQIADRFLPYLFFIMPFTIIPHLNSSQSCSLLTVILLLIYAIAISFTYSFRYTLGLIQ